MPGYANLFHRLFETPSALAIAHQCESPATLLELGQEFDAIAPAIDRLVDVLTNPLAWISLFVGIGAVRLLMRLGR